METATMIPTTTTTAIPKSAKAKRPAGIARSGGGPIEGAVILTIPGLLAKAQEASR